MKRRERREPIWYWFATTAAIASGAIVGAGAAWAAVAAVALALEHVEDRREKAQRRRKAETT